MRNSRGGKVNNWFDGFLERLFPLLEDVPWFEKKVDNAWDGMRRHSHRNPWGAYRLIYNRKCRTNVGQIIPVTIGDVPEHGKKKQPGRRRGGGEPSWENTFEEDKRLTGVGGGDRP